ncbi:hypothetical protein QJS10_CPB11g00555 [Acorus calamus]|uniref:Late embryogenesis abundant protein LEA-2 subgroup domain-containing protein n=1 Tax=Acorus calamus TaxID=4465 RepID=A0AAV9DS95_ACOCL|nr:hypothetical protein QJS10_CPB11g00555 [Acorus calamus]
MSKEGKKGHGLGRLVRGGFLTSFCCFILFLIFLAGLISLIVWLVYRPSKPKFTVVTAAVYNLNATSPYPPAVTSSFQFTIAIRNPSHRSSIRYDRLLGYVVYRDQAITPPLELPPLYQEEESTVAISPILGGTFVPVSTDISSGLAMDEAYGVVPLRVVLMGRIKYKSGAFKSAWNSLYVRCDVLVGLKRGLVGQVPLLGSSDCSVSV